MTRASMSWLLAPLALSLACGDSGGASASASDGLSDSASNITSVSESATTPTTSGASASASAGDTTQGSMSGDSQSSGDASSGDVSDSASEGTTSGASTGAVASTDGPGESSGGGSSTGSGPTPCQVEKTKIVPTPSDVLLVLDKSGSMSMQKWDHDDNPQTPTVTRWYSLHGVVESVVTKFNKTVNFGVKLYPKIDAGSYENVGACIVNPGVEVEIAPMNAAGVLAGIPAADFAVLGGTPMESGLKAAYTYLQALDPNKQRFALMVADGEISKTCAGEVYKEALGLVKTAHDMGIPTYVVGIDVDPMVSADLQSLATAGGKLNPNNPQGFYETTSQIELQAALQQIVDDTLSCVIDVTPEPSEPELFEVWIKQSQVPAAVNCAKDSGWVWTKPYMQIELCGQACLDLKKSGEVEARYFCEAG
ncbi:MAG: VWA domain-containing protein [Nannocystis sp.]|uniref:vWA domain-containing protein n=1 Tax=Nannocystis sp. TaxID=1962667 RepID=UPI00242851F4|nr:vWA domain-containing protein [Nannocystis sp.]MBK9752843.1 VWA domain-containing protein [Nannocystis sp.]